MKLKKAKRFIKSILPSFTPKLYTVLKRTFRVFVARVKLLLHLPIRKKKPVKIMFEINLAEHCNLNCYACSNFSCIAEPEFVDPEEFRRDMSRMGEIFGHECKRIYLIGGEPLLNPEVCNLMKIARENFTKGDIFLFTNGLLLNKQPASFWETCRDNNISILITPYPLKLDMPSIRNSADKFGVPVNWTWDDEENERSAFSVQPINLEGSNNPLLNFALCLRAVNCITLKHGKLFTCTFAAHVGHFNKRFGKNVNITEADYVDIYKTDDPDEILRRLTEPIPACRYCDKVHIEKSVEWQHTEQEITEWL